MPDIMKYKNEITNWAGFIGMLTGGIAMYFKDSFPEAAGICGSIALLCGAIIGWFTGKTAAKLIVAFLLVPLILSGCAFAPLSSRMGAQTGKNYQEAYAIGATSADQIAKVWPFVSGEIKGTFPEYESIFSPSLQGVIASLDKTCSQATLTDSDRGLIIGLVNRLEYEAGKVFYDKWGVTLVGKIKALVM